MNSTVKSKSSFRAAILVGSIAALFIPAKGMATDALFIGSATDHNLTTGSNWVGGTAAGDWDRLIFGSDVVDGNLSLDNFNGRSGITLTSGLTQDITINGPQPLIMGAVTSDGFIDMSAATHNLTINTQYWDWSPIEWNVGAGATLFVNGGIFENASHSLTKDGAGNAWITAAGNRTGTTIINGGALVALRSTLGTGAVTINNGGTLYVNDQWVLCGVNGFGVAEQNVASVTVNAGGQLALDGGNGYANGATNLYLNGGSVTGGNNGQPYGGLYLYNGNEQITAAGATTSTISTSLALTGNNNTITVDAGSALNITNVLKDNGAWGAGGFIKAGGGTLTLSGANNYSGTTVVNGGTVRFIDTAPNSSASLSIASGATLEFNVSTAPTPFDGAHVQLGAVGGTTVTGTGTFVKSGAGVLALDGQGGNHAVTFNMTGGLIDIQGGTLRNGGWDGGHWSSNLASMNVATGAMFDIWGGQSVVVDALTGGGTIDATSYGNTQSLTVGANNGSGTFSGVFQNTTGSLGLIKTGSGTQTLSGANTYTGGTTVSGGTLQLSGAGTFGSGSVVNNANIEFSRSMDYVNAVSGTGTTAVDNNSILRVFSNSSYSSGAISVNNGGSFMVWASNDGNPAGNTPATIANNFVLNSMGQGQNRGAINQDGGGGLVTLNGSITLAGDSRIGTGGGSWNSMDINGQVTGGGKLYVWERHDANPSTQLTLNNSLNNYSGGTEIEQGRLSITQATALGTGPVTITGADSQLLVDEVSGTIANNFTLGGGGNPTSTNYAYGNATMVFHNDGQNATIAGTVTLAGDAKIRGYSAGGTTNFSNPIGGTGNLTFEAGGATLQHTQIWTLGGSASTFTGNVNVSSDGSANAYLLLNGGGLPSTAVLTLADPNPYYFIGYAGNNAVLDLNGQNQTLAGLLETNGGHPGTGAFVTNSGNTQSTLTINNSAADTFTGIIGVNTAVTLVNPGAIVPEPIGLGNIALVKSGAGTLTLTGANTYTGDTTINVGTLQIAGAGSLGSGSYAGAISIDTGANLQYSSSADQTFSGVISGAGSLTKDTSSSTLTLSAANTYSGVTTLAGGVLNVASFSDYGVAGGLGNRSADGGGDVGILFRGGTLQYTGSTAQSTNRAIRINADGGGGNAGGATIDASGSNPGATLSFTATSSPDFFEFGGTRTLTLTGSNTGANTFAMAITETGGTTSVVKSGVGQWVLSGANTYTGTTTLSQGNLRFASAGGPAVQGPVVLTNSGFLIMDQANQFGPNSTLTFNSAPDAEFALYGHDQTIAGLSSTGGVAVVENSHGGIGPASASSTLTINQNFNSYYNGYIRDNTGNDSFKLSLVKNGSGNLQLDGGAISYTGSTTVNNGTLQISNPAVVASTSSLIVNGGTLYFDPNNDNATIATPISLNGGQMQTYVEGAQLTFSGPVTLGGNSQIQGFAAGSTLYFTNAIGGTGNLTFLGNGGGLGHKDFMVLSGASNFNGDLYIENYAAMAEVKLSGGDNRLPTTSVVHIGAGAWNAAHASALDLNGNNQMIAGLSDSGVSSVLGNRSVVNTSGTPVTLTLNTPADQSFSGTIGGTDIWSNPGNNLALVKSGSGTQTLSGANTYTGPTAVNAGRLEISNTNASNIVIGGGTLGGAGGTTTGSVTVNTGSIDPGTGAGTAGTLTMASLTLTGGSLHADLLGLPTMGTFGTGSYDRLIVNGTVALGLGAASLDLSTTQTAAAGQIFYLVDNTTGGNGGNTGTSGYFNGLTEGTTFTVGAQTYKITYQANAEGNSFTGGNDVAIELAPTGYPYSQYVTDHSGLGAANESTANDGILNLLKYALGVSTPTVYSGQLITYSLSGGNENQITFTRPRTGATNYPSDITSYQVQASSDLINWTNLTTPGVGTGTGTETITVTDTGFPTTGGPRFIRLVVTN